MKLSYIKNQYGNLIKERIDYIFSAFLKEFSDIEYDERYSIIGIGQPNNYLLCYFKIQNGNLMVKFKAKDKAILLTEDIKVIDLCISETISLFKNNDLLKIKSISKKIDVEKIAKEIIADGKTIDEIIAETVQTKGEIVIRDIVQNRIADALENVGVIKIFDLDGWTFEKLLTVKRLSVKGIKVLCYTFVALLSGETLRQVGDKTFSSLHKQYSEKIVNRYAKREKVCKYLSTINYDENNFEKGTVGYALCLMKKTKTNIVLNFCEDSNKLYQAYEDNFNLFANYLEETKKFLINIAKQVVEDERDKSIVLSLLGVDGNHYTLEFLGDKYNISRERVRQIYKKSLKKVANSFKAFSDEGVLRCRLREDYCKLFETCPIDAFMLYLLKEKQRNILNAIYSVVLYGVLVPEDLDKRLFDAQYFIAKSNKSNPIKTNVSDKDACYIRYKGFQVIIDDDGEVLTDLELLEKLRKERLRFAYQEGLPAYCVYHNKQLVLLATLKPLNKKTYSSLRGFTENSWEKHGCYMVEIIKNHVNNKTQI